MTEFIFINMYDLDYSCMSHPKFSQLPKKNHKDMKTIEIRYVLNIFGSEAI